MCVMGWRRKIGACQRGFASAGNDLRKGDAMTTTMTLLHTLTRTRRRFLGSAAMAMLAAHLGRVGSARARITATNAGALPAREEPSMTGIATPATATADIQPFQIDVPQADLDDLRKRLAATRLPSKELVDDRSQGVQLATIQELTRYWATDYDWSKVEA